MSLLSEQPDRAFLASALGAAVLAERPHLFSAALLELPGDELAILQGFIAAVTELVALPGYQAAVAARHGFALCLMPPGVCLGFDFHRTAAGPQLIEINTNAGGSLLVTLLEQAWGLHGAAANAEDALWRMFAAEWAGWASGRALRTVAIVDENPEQQYLYPEFLRWQQLFAAHGVEALICAPEALRCDPDGHLWLGEVAIDLVYNRLTDFSLTSPAYSALQQAWMAQVAGKTRGSLITPQPQAHAFWADKRNLQWLCDATTLQGFGLSAAQVAKIVRCVPLTVPVLADSAEQVEWFWSERKGLFFKPQAGFGSRATYRGDKLTKRVFDEILQGGYVAQALVPPPVWPTQSPETGEAVMLKYDLRVYAYAGEIQLLAGRLYQGQTTNFRTPGGGFAPVCVVSR